MYEEGSSIRRPTDHLVGRVIIDQLPKLRQECGNVGRGPDDEMV